MAYTKEQHKADHDPKRTPVDGCEFCRKEREPIQRRFGEGASSSVIRPKVDEK